jgi:hypothetical protein
MQFLQFYVHSTCPWLQLYHVKVLHETHENFWNTNICNFGCFIPTQCNSELIWQKYKFLQFIPVQQSLIFKICLLCIFLYTALTKLNSFHKTFSNNFFHDTYFVKILQTTDCISTHTHTNNLLSMTHSTTTCLSHVSALMKRSTVWADSIKEITILFSSNMGHD